MPGGLASQLGLGTCRAGNSRPFCLSTVKALVTGIVIQA
jgi:hypothetical protein